MEEIDGLLPCPVKLTHFLRRSGGDVFCVIDKDVPRLIVEQFATMRSLDNAFDEEVSCFYATNIALPTIYAPVGEITDYHDVRVYYQAAARAMKRAVAAGFRSPLLFLPHSVQFPTSEICSILGALSALYVPIQLRESEPSKAQLVLKLIMQNSNSNGQSIYKQAVVIESGRFVARDIGAGDPECMCPSLLENYILSIFPNFVMEVSMEDDDIIKEFPLFDAVNRAGITTNRHRGRIVFLQYEPPNPVKKTLLMVGKGVCYDTGGADVKRGGVMSGNSRDKCGAATVAGFMQIVDQVRPPDVHVMAALCLVRNCIGEESFVPTEVITARSGVSVRVGNTSAEAGMCMADALCRMKEIVLIQRLPDPHFITLGTLTGHACLTAGEGNSIVIDNSVAQLYGHATRLKEIGALYGEPIEISTLRPEDFSVHHGQVLGEDIIQCTNSASSKTPRGHQKAVAFMLLASGLDKYGLHSMKPMKYSHIDIAANAVDEYPQIPTGAPLAALAKTHLNF